MANTDSYPKQAKKYFCNISLGNLSFCKKELPFIKDDSTMSSDIYQKLVLYSPCKESNLGVKISKKLEQKLTALVDEILKGLDVKHCYLFSAYDPKDSSKQDLSKSIATQSETFLLLYSPENVSESIYASIRNALAHGNILKHGNHYYLYALSKRGSTKSEQERKLSFLLKIYKLSSLCAYINAFEKYN